MKPILLPLVLSLAATIADDETILGRNNYYTVADGASFECMFSGAHCIFSETNFASFNYQGEQPTTTVEGMVWAALDVTTDCMQLGACTGDVCLVTCTANCTCTTEPDDLPCPQATTSAPTTATPTAAPVPQQCPEVQITELCGKLMERVSPNRQHNCYNFCRGVFLSECGFSGSCGSLSCNNQTTTGLDGLIFGCTDADRASPAGAPVSVGNSSGTIGVATSSILSWLAFFLFLILG